MFSNTNRFPRLARAGRIALSLAAAAALAVGAVSCSSAPVDPVKVQPKYTSMPPEANLASYLRGTVRDYTVVANDNNLQVSSYGLVVNLDNTGNSDAPTPVRQWMIKELYRHHIGNPSDPVYRHTEPEDVLADPRVAVVEVGGFIPPGTRKGQKFDVIVQAMPGNTTKSLARGLLYECDLRLDGANAFNPGGSVNSYATAQGYLLVNPVYAMQSGKLSSEAQASLRNAIIPAGGIAQVDREIQLRLRTPSWAMSRSIQKRIVDYYQDSSVAAAQDEGLVYLYTPYSYKGNWRHFMGVVRHLYLNSSPGFAALKSKELAEAALRPNADLGDISFCWEGLGQAALPYIQPLLSSRQPEVAYAAARACAFLNDHFGEECLMKIAQTSDNPFRLAAVQDFADMNNTPGVCAQLADLLNDPDALVRIEAYKALVSANDAHIFTQEISPRNDLENHFSLDIIDSSAPPLIYVSRTGDPRIAIFGHNLSMTTPVVFSAFDARLTIATPDQQPQLVNIFYRSDDMHDPIQVLSHPQVAELVARLGGVGPAGSGGNLHFNYGDVVAMLQSLTASHKVAAQFVLQPSGVQRQINRAPSLRPQSERSQSINPSAPAADVTAARGGASGVAPAGASGVAPAGPSGNARPQ